MTKLARALILFFATAIFAATASAHPVVINADAYFDSVAGEMVSPAVIVVNHGEIIAVNPESTPESATVIELADIIAVPGNPLEDITLLQNVTFVMKAGEVYKHPGSTH